MLSDCQSCWSLLSAQSPAADSPDASLRVKVPREDPRKNKKAPQEDSKKRKKVSREDSKKRKNRCILEEKHKTRHENKGCFSLDKQKLLQR